MFVNAGMSLAVTQPVANHDQPTINPIKSSSEDGLVKIQILLKTRVLTKTTDFWNKKKIKTQNN